MSKSRGNVLDPGLLRDVFGIEVLRYFLLREMVFGQDCNLNFDAIIQRANSDLANDLGNLLSRTVAMIAKYRKGVVPRSGNARGDADVEDVAARVLVEYKKHFDNYQFSRAVEKVWELVSRVNKYIVENQPWAIAKDDDKAPQLDGVLFHCAEALRLSAVMLAPVMPESSQRIWEQLGLEGKVADASLGELAWSDTLSGIKLRGGDALFPRVEAKAVYAKLEAGLDAQARSGTAGAGDETDAGVPALAPEITIDDFVKVDLRVGTVLEAEPIKGADKLLRMVVDVGFESRQVLAGDCEVL